MEILWVFIFLTSIQAHGATPPPIPENIAAPAVALGDAFAAVADQMKGSVVSVISEKRVRARSEEYPFSFPFEDPFFRQFFGNQRGRVNPPQVPVEGLGSGFILDSEGHILTNNHVVKGMEKIHVILPTKESYDAKVIGSDAKTDIAVLQLKGSFPKDLPSARLGDSDTLKSGYLVLAFGAPFGLPQTVTSGIISATGRSNVGIADIEDFLQTDTPINPGNSGGPLVNMRGEVIGINTAIATSIGQSAGVGFAIPINMAKEILPTLLQGKPVIRGSLGISVQDLTPSLERQFHLTSIKGALVSQVNPGSPAEKAGIKSGDVIVQFDKQSVDDSRQLREKVARHKPGSTEDITLMRNGKKLTVTAKLGELQSESPLTQKPSAAAKSSLEKFGIQAKTITPELQRQLDLKEKKGIVIVAVEALSPASLAGLQPGDVITEVDRKKIDNLNQAEEILSKSSSPHEVLLLVNHKGESIYVTLETG